MGLWSYPSDDDAGEWVSSAEELESSLPAATNPFIYIYTDDYGNTVITDNEPVTVHPVTKVSLSTYFQPVRMTMPAPITTGLVNVSSPVDPGVPDGPKIIEASVRDGIRVSGGDVASSSDEVFPALVDSGDGTTPWENKDAVKVADSLAATIRLETDGYSNKLIASGFNFNLPPGAVISGVKARAYRKFTTMAEILNDIGIVIAGDRQMIITSPDANSYSEEVSNLAFNASAGLMYGAVYFEGYYYRSGFELDGLKIAKSEDGITWVDAGTANLPADTLYTWGMATSGNEIVTIAIRQDDWVIIRSTDGVNWTATKTVPESSSYAGDIIWNEAYSKYFVCTTGGTDIIDFYSSTDGSSWTLTTKALASSWNGLYKMAAKENGDMVAFCMFNYVVTSTDGGSTWVETLAAVSGGAMTLDQYNSLGGSGDYFFRIDKNGFDGPLYSSDGINWNKIELGDTISAELTGVRMGGAVYAGGYYILTGVHKHDTVYSGLVLYSTDCVNWSVYLTGTAGTASQNVLGAIAVKG